MSRKRIRPLDDEKDEADDLKGDKKRSSKRKNLKTDGKGRKTQNEEQIEMLMSPELRYKRDISVIKNHKADKKSKSRSNISRPSDQKHRPKDSKHRNRKRKHLKRKKSKSSRDSRRTANDSKRRDRQDEIIDSSEANEMKEPMKVSRRPSRPQIRKSNKRHRSEDEDSDERHRERRVEDSMDISLMSRRMMAPERGNRSNSEASRNANRPVDSYEKLKIQTENILTEKLKGLVGSLRNCTERICKSTCKQTQDYGKRLVEHVRKVIKKENQIALAVYEDKISKSQTFLRRCEMLEKQLASSETRSALLANKARLSETSKHKHKALEGEYKSVCEHNTALQIELSEVKQKFQEQLAEKTAQIDVLREVRSSLISRAKEFREENEKSQETHRAKYDSHLNRIREERAKEIGKLQVQCSELMTSNLDLSQKNQNLENILKENEIEPAVVKTGAATPERGAVAPQSSAEDVNVATPHSGNRGESVRKQSLRSSATLISMLKADISSLRVSLETTSTQLTELRDICNIYLILTGLRITKNELYFECLAHNTKARIKFLFSLICHDNGSSILYEKNAWEADRKCPGFLNDCSGQFFESKFGPLFLKNVIKEVFSPDIPASEPVVA